MPQLAYTDYNTNIISNSDEMGVRRDKLCHYW